MAKSGNIGCAICGRTPTRSITVRRHQGMIFLMRFIKVKRSLCRDHGVAMTKSYLGKTALQGWWGIISVMVNPFVMLWDLRVLVAYKRMPAPPPVVRPTPGNPLQLRRFDGSLMPTPF